MATKTRQSDSAPPDRRARWWALAFGVTALIALLIAAGAWYYLAGEPVWVTATGEQVAPADQPIRRVLWDPPHPLQGPLNSDEEEYEPSLSPDETRVYFVRGLPGANADLYTARRTDTGWSKPVPLTAINTGYDELGPRLSPDGSVLLFYSNRPGGVGEYDLYAARRTPDGWGPAVNLRTVNSPANEFSPAVAPDGRVVFASNRHILEDDPNANEWKATIRHHRDGDYDLYVASPKRPDPLTDANAPLEHIYAEPVPIRGAGSDYHEGGASFSPDGALLTFASNRPGGMGGFDLYRGRLVEDEIRDLTPLGKPINTPANETDPYLSADGFSMIYSTDAAGEGGYDLVRSRSREVFVDHVARGLPDLHWSHWVLLVGLAALIPMLLFLKAADYRHFSLLQKCVLLSILAHVLLTVLLGFIVVSAQVVEYVAEEAGLITSVNMEISREVQMRMDIRRVDAGLPVADPTLADVQTSAETTPPRAAPKPVEQNIPDSRVQPTVQTVQPTTPVESRQPAEIVEPPVSEVSPETIAVNMPAPQRVRRQETEPAEPTETPQDAPPAEDTPPIETAPDTLDVAQPTPARPQSEPVVPSEATIASRPLEIQPTAEPAPPIPEDRLDIEASLLATKAVNTSEPNAPVITDRDADDAPARTDEPTPEAPSTPVAVTAAPSLTVETTELKVAANPAVTRRAADEPTQPTELPTAPRARTVTLPALAGARLNEQVERTNVTAIEPTDPMVAAAIEPASTDPVDPAEVAPAPVRPVERSSESLVRQPVAPTRQPRPASQFTSELAIRLRPQQPSGKLEPGRLTAPPSFFERSVEMRPRLVKAFGGSEKSEAAVERALKFLQQTQEDKGQWTVKGKAAVDRKKRKRDSTSSKDMALTGLATLCFLGHDHTHTKDGPYRKTITRALDYLVTNQGDDGNLMGQKAGNDRMYNHGIAALALAEAAGMTDDKKIRAAAVKAAKFCVSAQNRRDGGWRYTPRHRDSDTSVFGWQVMAMRSAELTGDFKIPDGSRKLSRKWLAKCGSGPGRVLSAYQGGKPTPVMTAEGVFARILLGQTLDDEQTAAAAKTIFSRGPTRDRNFYYWYYGSLALMQLEDDHWEKWNAQLRDSLVKRQNTRGAAAGSWDPKGKWADRGGRVYSTAMATLTLEVYYRYLPMLRKTTNDTDRK
ncbi:MAG: hypothetical protein ACLFTN_08550 [Phycisphaerae bacterium]